MGIGIRMLIPRPGTPLKPNRNLNVRLATNNVRGVMRRMKADLNANLGGGTRSARATPGIRAAGRSSAGTGADRWTDPDQ